MPVQSLSLFCLVSQDLVAFWYLQYSVLIEPRAAVWPQGPQAFPHVTVPGRCVTRTQLAGPVVWGCLRVCISHRVPGVESVPAGSLEGHLWVPEGLSVGFEPLA